MAATLTFQANAGKQPAAPTFVDRFRVQGDTSYPTGGYELKLDEELPGKTVIQAFANPQVANDWGFSYDRASDKLIVFVISTGAQVGSGVDLAAMDTELVVISK